MGNEFKNWQKDLEGFLSAQAETPPSHLSQSVLAHVQSSLNPSPVRLLPKLTAIYLITGLASLAVCPQLGVGPIGGGHGLMSFVMTWGAWACASFCGSFFMGTATLVSLFILKPEEARVVLRSSLWQFPVLLAFLFAALMAVKTWTGNVSSFVDPQYLALWAGSAIIASLLVYRAGYRLRWHFTATER